MFEGLEESFYLSKKYNRKINFFKIKSGLSQEEWEEKGQEQATIDEGLSRGGRGRFFVYAKPTQGCLLGGAKKKGAIE